MLILIVELTVGADTWYVSFNDTNILFIDALAESDILRYSSKISNP